MSHHICLVLFVVPLHSVVPCSSFLNLLVLFYLLLEQTVVMWEGEGWEEDEKGGAASLSVTAVRERSLHSL